MIAPGSSRTCTILLCLALSIMGPLLAKGFQYYDKTVFMLFSFVLGHSIITIIWMFSYYSNVAYKERSIKGFINRQYNYFIDFMVGILLSGIPYAAICTISTQTHIPLYNCHYTIIPLVILFIRMRKIRYSDKYELISYAISIISSIFIFISYKIEKELNFSKGEIIIVLATMISVAAGTILSRSIVSNDEFIIRSVYYSFGSLFTLILFTLYYFSGISDLFQMFGKADYNYFIYPILFGAILIPTILLTTAELLRTLSIVNIFEAGQSAFVIDSIYHLIFEHTAQNNITYLCMSCGVLFMAISLKLILSARNAKLSIFTTPVL